jgi:hypothetical protein
MESLTVDIPLDGLGLIGFPAADAISPVYTVWITLVLMYLGDPTPSRPAFAIFNFHLHHLISVGSEVGVAQLGDV